MSATVAAAWGRRRPWMSVVAKLVVLALVVEFLVLPQLGSSWHELPRLFHIANRWIGVAMLAELGSLLVFALATVALLRRGVRPPVHRVVRIDLSSIAVSHCMPGGGAAGSALGCRLLNRAGVPTSDAWFAKLAQGIGSAVVLQILLLVTLLSELVTHGPTPWTLIPAIADLGAIAALALFVGVVKAPQLRRRRRRIVRLLRGRLAEPVRRPLQGFVTAAALQIREARKEPGRLSLAAGWAAANWLLDAVALWAAMHAYGTPVPFDSLLIAFCIAGTVSWIPVSPSGIGISDAVMIPALIAAGASRPEVLLGIITWRIVSFWLPIPLGLVAYGSLHARDSRFLGRWLATDVTPPTFGIPRSWRMVGRITRNRGLGAGDPTLGVQTVGAVTAHGLGRPRP